MPLSASLRRPSLPAAAHVRFQLARTYARAALPTLTVLGGLFVASEAAAGDTTYAPPPNYAPPQATVTYAPPPNYGPAPPPPPPQQYQYAPPPPAYGPRPAYGSGFDIARQGGTIGGVLGFGTDSYYGFALGVWGGYTLPFHLYLGGAFNYFTGDSFVSSYLFEFQVGYDLAVIPRAPVLIRPYGGLGYEHFSYGNFGCIDNLDCTNGGLGSLVISIGAQGSYFFTPHWFAGVDIRLDIPTAGQVDHNYVVDPNVFDLFAQGGYKF
jgi:hypothetical protein